MRHKSTYFYVNYGIYASMWVLYDKDIKHKTQSKNFKKIYFFTILNVTVVNIITLLLVSSVLDGG